MTPAFFRVHPSPTSDSLLHLPHKLIVDEASAPAQGKIMATLAEMPQPMKFDGWIPEKISAPVSVARELRVAYILLRMLALMQRDWCLATRDLAQLHGVNPFRVHNPFPSG